MGNVPSRQYHVRLAVHTLHRVRVWSNRLCRGNKTIMTEILINLGLDALEKQERREDPDVILPAKKEPVVEKEDESCCHKS